MLADDGSIVGCPDPPVKAYPYPAIIYWEIEAAVRNFMTTLNEMKSNQGREILLSSSDIERTVLPCHPRTIFFPHYARISVSHFQRVTSHLFWIFSSYGHTFGLAEKTNELFAIIRSLLQSKFVDDVSSLTKFSDKFFLCVAGGTISELRKLSSECDKMRLKHKTLVTVASAIYPKMIEISERLRTPLKLYTCLEEQIPSWLSDDEKEIWIDSFKRNKGRFQFVRCPSNREMFTYFQENYERRTRFETFLLGTHHRLGRKTFYNQICDDVLWLICEEIFPDHRTKPYYDNKNFIY